MSLTPHKIPAILPKLFPGLLWHIREEPVLKTIYLTFDDGPVPGPTEFVLEVLRAHSIPATFFCIGDNVRKHPDIFTRIITEGHAIGNHTFNHLKGWSTSNNDYLKNIRQCADEFVKQSGKSSNLFRPPYGRIRRQQIKLLDEYKIIMWDVLSLDYQPNQDTGKLLRGTINATRPGSIVVFHDSYKAELNLKFMLPNYIAHFLREGFQFKSLSFPEVDRVPNSKS